MSSSVQTASAALVPIGAGLPPLGSNPGCAFSPIGLPLGRSSRSEHAEESPLATPFLVRHSSAESGISRLLQTRPPYRHLRVASVGEQSLLAGVQASFQTAAPKIVQEDHPLPTFSDVPNSGPHSPQASFVPSGTSCGSDVELATPSTSFGQHLSVGAASTTPGSAGDLTSPSTLFGRRLHLGEVQEDDSTEGPFLSPASGPRLSLTVTFDSEEETSDTDVNPPDLEGEPRAIKRTNQLGTNIRCLGGGPTTVRRSLTQLSGTPSTAPRGELFALLFTPRPACQGGVNGSYVLSVQTSTGKPPEETVIFKPDALSLGTKQQASEVRKSRYGIDPRQQTEREVIGSYLGHYDGVPFTVAMVVPMPQKVLPEHVHNSPSRRKGTVTEDRVVMLPKDETATSSCVSSPEVCAAAAASASAAATTSPISSIVSLRGSAQEFVKGGIPLNTRFTLKEVEQDVEIEAEEGGVKTAKTVKKIVKVQLPFDFAERVGRVPVEALQRLAKFDMRTCNTDRHAGNLLLIENFTTTTVMEENVPVHVDSRLVLIDNGCIASERFKDSALFCWLMWPERYRGVGVFEKAFLEPFSEKLQQEIASCNWAEEQRTILQTFPDFPPAALQTLEISLMLQQKGVAKGLTPFQIACFQTMPKTEEKGSLTECMTPMFLLYRAAANFSDDDLADVALIGVWLDAMIDNLLAAIRKGEVAGDSFAGICAFLGNLARLQSNAQRDKLRSSPDTDM